MDKKLIAVDLDGTTLNQQSFISDKTKQVFEKAKEAGHIISIATGRPYRNSKHYYDQLKMITPMINFNGALCHLPNEKNWSNQYHKTISRDIALDMLDLKKDFDIKLIAAELLDTVYTDESFLPYPDFFPHGQKDVLKLSATSLKQSPTSVCVFTAQENQQQIIDKIIQRYGNLVEVRTWGGHTPCLEVVSAGVQKALGVERVASAYGIKQQHVIAFGDEDNDYEMIQYAGNGVVMKNGIQALKDIANDITPETNDNDGLALYLEKYLRL